MNHPDLSLIVAMTPKERIIGRGNSIPWKLPTDMRHFKEITLAEGVVIMGRKTWDSFPDKFRPLPKRYNIILTRTPFPSGDAFESTNLLEDVFAAVAARGNKACVIGGEEIYRMLLPYVQKMHITVVNAPNEASLQGDAFFPEVDLSKWTCTAKSGTQQFPGDEYLMQFEEWVRKT